MSSAIAAGQVGSAAAVEEQGVAADQPPVDMKALAARSMPGSVDQADLDRPDLHDVARIVDGEVVVAHAGGSLHPRHFVALHMDRAIDVFEQGGDAFDRVAHHRATDVVGVIVGREHTRHLHAVGCHGADQIVHCIRRIDQ